MSKMTLAEVKNICFFLRTMHELDLSKWEVQDFEIFTLGLYTDSYVQLLALIRENT